MNAKSAAQLIGPVESDAQPAPPIFLHEESTSPLPLCFNGAPQVETGQKQTQEDKAEIEDSDEEEAWEEELQETIQPKCQTHSWKALHGQLQKSSRRVIKLALYL